MNGLDAINHYNGWAMASIGAGIVFSGLVILSFAISQLKRLVGFLEKEETSTEEAGATGRPQGDSSATSAISIPSQWPTDIQEIAAIYQPLFDRLGSSFQLEDLYKLTEENDFPHPHLTIKQLREARILVPAGDGTFSAQQ